MKYFLITLALFFVGCSTGTTTPNEDVKDYQKINFAGEKATSAERAKCEAVGGTVRRAGMAGWEHCIQDMPDAGEVCTDSSECVARCTTPQQEARSYQFGDPATGQCSQTDEVFGCFTEVIDGKAEATLCVD